MNSSLEKLEDDKILSTDDIKLIKLHLEENYQHYTSADRAKLFSKKITSIVENGLLEIEHPHRIEVKRNLIKTFATSQEGQITNKHLFDEITEIEEPVWKNWVKEKYGDDIKISDLEYYLRRKEYNSRIAYFKDLFKRNYRGIFSYQKAINALRRIYKQTANINLHIKPKVLLTVLLLCLISFSTVYGVINYLEKATEYHISFHEYSRVRLTSSVLVDDLMDHTDLLVANDQAGYPELFKYTPVNTKKLKLYLKDKNSKLLEDDYLTVLIEIAREYNVHPILLVSIIGQEQGFIPSDHPQAAAIINNPYNVFGSWKDFNTNFQDSTKIAAVSINNILDNRPLGEEPFTWLNTTYAEDINWHKGVKYFFYRITELVNI